jgi:hypothetical protein
VQHKKPSSVKAKGDSQQSHCSRSPDERNTHSIGVSFIRSFLSKLSHNAFLSFFSDGLFFLVRLLEIVVEIVGEENTEAIKY